MRVLFLYLLLMVTAFASTPTFNVSIYDTEDNILVGDTTTYVISVRNEGLVACSQLRIKNYIPSQSSLVEVKSEEDYELRGHCIVFHPRLSLEAGANLTYTIKVKSTEQGYMKNVAAVSCDELTTSIVVEELTIVSKKREHWAFHMSVYDTNDPVRLGSETSYVLSVRNEGMTACENLTVRHVIPWKMKFKNASGEYKLENNQVVFSNISLARGEKTSFKITLTALDTGSITVSNILQMQGKNWVVEHQEGTVIL